MKKITTVLTLIILLITSCTREKDPSLFPGGNGLFLLNEGNYMAGNGSLSFYSTENGNIYNDLFNSKNNRTIGDIPTFLAVDGGTGYVVVNNSGTIEKIDMQTMASLSTITGLTSPRQMVIYNGKGYVSSLFSNIITVIDLTTFVVEEEINIGCSSEALLVSGTTLLAANWSGGSRIVAVNLSDNQVKGSVTTGMEPESMVLDKNGKLWVLCTGGWNNEEIPRICRVNVSDLTVEATFMFRTNTDNPSSLTINAGKDTLYYIDEGIRRMPLIVSELPSEVLVSPGTSLFYKVAPAPWKGMFAVTDAVDYQQKGRLLVFDKNGELIDTEDAGIIPGFIRYTE